MTVGLLLWYLSSSPVFPGTDIIMIIMLKGGINMNFVWKRTRGVQQMSNLHSCCLIWPKLNFHCTLRYQLCPQWPLRTADQWSMRATLVESGISPMIQPSVAKHSNDSTDSIHPILLWLHTVRLMIEYRGHDDSLTPTIHIRMWIIGCN